MDRMQRWELMVRSPGTRPAEQDTVRTEISCICSKSLDSFGDCTVPKSVIAFRIPPKPSEKAKRSTL